jgi:hypothetical protein
LIDRDRKREADRARRARIKAGEWDFPNGGAAELARAGSRRALRAAVASDGISPGTPMFSAGISARATSPLSARAATLTARGPIPDEPLAGRVGRPATEIGAVRHAPTASDTSVNIAAPAPRAGAPASMVAIGGKPGRGLVPQGYGYPAPPDLAAVSTFTKWRTNTETMLAALAAKSDAQERRIAALETAAADRRADVLAVAKAFAGLFRFAVRR